MGALPITRISVEEYLAADRVAELRSEYHDGEVFPVVAASWAHSLLTVNLGRRLSERLDGTPCRVAGAPRVRATARNYVYPDVAIVCGQPQLADSHADIVLNPQVIIEVLSPSTADFDYGGKFALYRTLSSLQEYILVSQDAYLVEVFRRVPEHQWMLSSYAGAEAVVPIECLSIALPLTELYAGVEIQAA
ncbi:MAG: Uma2 family endonuclease [Acidobacteria bacterium]|nr:Uma2 family endonuclease [Acidobacteriota bacterium]